MLRPASSSNNVEHQKQAKKNKTKRKDEHQKQEVTPPPANKFKLKLDKNHEALISSFRTFDGVLSQPMCHCQCLSEQFYVQSDSSSIQHRAPKTRLLPTAIENPTKSHGGGGGGEPQRRLGLSRSVSSLIPPPFISYHSEGEFPVVVAESGSSTTTNNPATTATNLVCAIVSSSSSLDPTTSCLSEGQKIIANGRPITATTSSLTGVLCGSCNSNSSAWSSRTMASQLGHKGGNGGHQDGSPGTLPHRRQKRRAFCRGCAGFITSSASSNSVSSFREGLGAGCGANEDDFGSASICVASSGSSNSSSSESSSGGRHHGGRHHRNCNTTSTSESESDSGSSSGSGCGHKPSCGSVTTTTEDRALTSCSTCSNSLSSISLSSVASCNQYLATCSPIAHLASCYSRPEVAERQSGRGACRLCITKTTKWPANDCEQQSVCRNSIQAPEQKQRMKMSTMMSTTHDSEWPSSKKATSSLWASSSMPSLALRPSCLSLAAQAKHYNNNNLGPMIDASPLSNEIPHNLSKLSPNSPLRRLEQHYQRRDSVPLIVPNHHFSSSNEEDDNNNSACLVKRRSISNHLLPLENSDPKEVAESRTEKIEPQQQQQNEQQQQPPSTSFANDYNDESATSCRQDGCRRQRRRNLDVAVKPPHDEQTEGPRVLSQRKQQKRRSAVIRRDRPHHQQQLKRGQYPTTAALSSEVLVCPASSSSVSLANFPLTNVQLPESCSEVRLASSGEFGIVAASSSSSQLRSAEVSQSAKTLLAAKPDVSTAAAVGESVAINKPSTTGRPCPRSSPLHRNQLQSFFLHEFVLTSERWNGQLAKLGRSKMISGSVESQPEAMGEEEEEDDEVEEDEEVEVAVGGEMEQLAEDLADFAQRNGCVHCHCRHQLLMLVRNEQILNRLTMRIKQDSERRHRKPPQQPIVPIDSVSAGSVDVRCTTLECPTSSSSATNKPVRLPHHADSLISLSSGSNFEANIGTNLQKSPRQKLAVDQPEVSDHPIQLPEGEGLEVELDSEEDMVEGEEASSESNCDDDNDDDVDGDGEEDEEEEELELGVEETEVEGLGDESDEQESEDSVSLLSASAATVSGSESSLNSPPSLSTTSSSFSSSSTAAVAAALGASNSKLAPERVSPARSEPLHNNNNSSSKLQTTYHRTPLTIHRKLLVNHTKREGEEASESIGGASLAQSQKHQPPAFNSAKTDAAIGSNTILSSRQLEMAAAEVDNSQEQLKLQFLQQLDAQQQQPQTAAGSMGGNNSQQQQQLVVASDQQHPSSGYQLSGSPSSGLRLQRQRRLAVSGASVGGNQNRRDELDVDPNDVRGSFTETSAMRPLTNVFGKRMTGNSDGWMQASTSLHQQQHRVEALNFYRQHFNNPNLVHRRHHRRQATDTAASAAFYLEDKLNLRSLSSTTDVSCYQIHDHTPSRTRPLISCNRNSHENESSNRHYHPHHYHHYSQTSVRRSHNEPDNYNAANARVEHRQQFHNKNRSYGPSQQEFMQTRRRHALGGQIVHDGDGHMPLMVPEAECLSLDKQDFVRMMNYGELEARPTFVLTRDLIKKSMPKYKRHDDLIIVQQSHWEEFKKSLPIPVVKDENSPFSIDEDELASLVCQTVQKPVCRRLAIDRGVKNDNYRTPDVELILGDTGIVNHKENQIVFRFDVTKCMFSFGNVREKMRMGELDCSDEIVVDLFAGIGYFTLPLLVHAKAKHLYACEWNPDAIESLKRNITINKVDPNRCTIIEGDNRSNRPTDVAQRVILGILPSCLEFIQTAFECIDKSTGATLHCHDLVESKPQPMGEKQTSINSLEASSTGDKPPSSSQSLLNQSISSSSSSYSTIEKLTAPIADDNKTQSSESDKDTSSPVFLEKPSGSCTNVSISTPEANCNFNDSSSCSSQLDDSISEPIPPIPDNELGPFEARGQALIACIEEEVEAHDLRARIIHIQPVKSYAPFVTHVVFDIKIEPKSAVGSNVEPFFHPEADTI